MSKIVSKPDHGLAIAITLDGKPLTISESYQNFFDDLELLLNTNLLGEVVTMAAYTVATVPDAASFVNGAIIVTDEVGGRTIATSDGVDWLRVSDGAVIS